MQWLLVVVLLTGNIPDTDDVKHVERFIDEGGCIVAAADALNRLEKRGFEAAVTCVPAPVVPRKESPWVPTPPPFCGIISSDDGTCSGEWKYWT